MHNFDTILVTGMKDLPPAGDAVMRGLAAACDASLAMPFRNHLDELHAEAFRNHVADAAVFDAAGDAKAALDWAEAYLMVCAVASPGVVRRRAANAYTLVHTALAEKLALAPDRDAILLLARQKENTSR